MTNNEKEALLQYLESRLFDFCAQIEYDDISSIYVGMYDILSDLEITMEAQIALNLAQSNKKST